MRTPVTAWGGPVRALLCLLCALTLAQCAFVDSAQRLTLISYGRFDEVHIYRPADTARRLVLVLSGDQGFTYRIASIARDLASDGTLVAGVDVREMLASLRHDPASCVSPGADLAALGNELERRYALPRGAPVLVGHSAGATLAYVALAQAPPGSFAGVITLSFCADLDLVKPLCRSSAVPAQPRTGGVRLLPPAVLPGRWVAFHGQDDTVCPPTDSQSFAARDAQVRFVPLPGVTHSYRHRERWWQQFMSAYRELAQPAASAGH
jgi:type IV secretory pathway VirJ component